MRINPRVLTMPQNYASFFKPFTSLVTVHLWWWWWLYFIRLNIKLRELFLIRRILVLICATVVANFFLLKLLFFFIIIRLFFGRRRFNHGPSCILILVFVNRGCVIFHRTREEVKWYETGAFRIGHYRTFHRPINMNVIYGLAHFFAVSSFSLIKSAPERQSPESCLR